jgi:hypothetical protein
MDHPMKMRVRRTASLLALLALASLPEAAAGQGGKADVLRGRVLPADGGDARGVRVFARAGAFADSAEVDSLGRFSLPLPEKLADSVELAVDAGDPAARAYHPARVRIGRGDAAKEQEVVLLPLRWTIRSGRYAGEAVEVSPERAFRTACERCSAFYRRVAARADSGRTLLQVWPEERFPLRVAFDREWSGVNVTRRDSLVFWSEARELEEVFGAGMFRPAAYRETLPVGEVEAHDVILVWFDPKLHGASGLGSAVSVGAEIEFGDVRLGRQALSADASMRGLVAHELMHTLGFGHTCAWRSVLADVRRCPELRADTATPEDVAYVQMAARVRALQREGRRRWAIEAALAGAEWERERGLVMR